MITRGNDMVGIECDAPGCSRSHTVGATRAIDGSPALDALLRKASQDGWSVVDAGSRILHLCPKCSSGQEGAQPMMMHVKPTGGPVMRGSKDPTGFLDGIVTSAQQVRGQAVQVKAGQEYIPAGTVVALDENGNAVPAKPGDEPVGVAVNALTPEEAKKVRAQRRRDLDRGTPGLSELPEEKRRELAEKLKQGKRAFSLTINLQEDGTNEDEPSEGKA